MNPMTPAKLAEILSQFATDNTIADCNARQTAFETALLAHRARSPGACVHCHGEGGKSFNGTLEQPPEYVECRHCLEQGLCPGCGKTSKVFKDWTNGEGPWAPDAPPVLTCPLCGWAHDGTGSEPEPPNCTCWEEAAAQHIDPDMAYEDQGPCPDYMIDF